MRDLGLMGENTFSLWCADAGLVPNPSNVDKTGWDFFVEFPFEKEVTSFPIHRPAFECKVQVKSTDKTDRRLQITLSNLRRLVTGQMPAFLVFIEFDGKEVAQRAFVVHVDNELITKVLRKLHKIEQSEGENKFHKRKMTIRYGDENRLEKANGDFLRRYFEDSIGDDISDYISKKRNHLEKAGYEEGFKQITFQTKGEENLKKLIDVSLGVAEEVELSSLSGMDIRFGVLSEDPRLASESGKLSMPNLKPTASGEITFKYDRLSTGLAYNCHVFNSPFNQMVSEELKKIRIEGEFFQILMNPCTGTSSFNFSFSERMELQELRKALKLLKLLSCLERPIDVEVKLEGIPKINLKFSSTDQEFEFPQELEALDEAVNIIKIFDVEDSIHISLDELANFQSQIRQFSDIVSNSGSCMKAEFSINEAGFDPSEDAACISLITAPIGSHIFGVICVIAGPVKIESENRYSLSSSNILIERKIVSRKGETVQDDVLTAEIKEIEERYREQYLIVNLVDKGKSQ